MIAKKGVSFWHTLFFTPPAAQRDDGNGRMGARVFRSNVTLKGAGGVDFFRRFLWVWVEKVFFRDNQFSVVYGNSLCRVADWRGIKSLRMLDNGSHEVVAHIRI